MSIISKAELAHLNWLKRQLYAAENLFESVNTHPLMRESFKHHIEEMKAKIKELDPKNTL